MYLIVSELNTSLNTNILETISSILILLYHGPLGFYSNNCGAATLLFHAGQPLLENISILWLLCTSVAKGMVGLRLLGMIFKFQINLVIVIKVTYLLKTIHVNYNSNYKSTTFFLTLCKFTMVEMEYK